VFMKEGPFDWLAGILGATVLLILVAYGRHRPRDLLQTAAFSAAFGFAGLLLVGLFLELVLEAQGLPLGQTPDGHPDSRLTPQWFLGAWVILAIGCFVVDGVVQRRRRVTKPESVASASVEAAA